jgi:hypothetical protein
MLIISIPKSASTSLVHTLGEIHSLESKQEFKKFKHYKIPLEFEILANYHSDVREINNLILDEWDRLDIFYKQHIPPTKNNLDLLKNSRKVILLRKPEEIILAYRRADIKGLHEKRDEFKGCIDEVDWIKRAKEIGLYRELVTFYKGWNFNNRNNLIIFFDELVKEERRTIEKISQFFSLTVSAENIELKKYRYSNYSSFQRLAYKFKEKLQNLFN